MKVDEILNRLCDSILVDKDEIKRRLIQAELLFDGPARDARDRRKSWYYCSYPIILEEARALIGSIKKNSVIERERITRMISFVMSWVARIPEAEVNNDVNMGVLKNHLLKLDGLKLEDISIEVDPNKFQNKFVNNPLNFTAERKKNIRVKFVSTNSKFDILEYMECINNLINGDKESRASSNLPTITKMMHFFNPELFPIMDSNVYKYLKSMSGKDEINGIRNSFYFDYLIALHILVNVDKCNKLFEGNVDLLRKITLIRVNLENVDSEIVSKLGIGKLRLIDMAIF